MIRKRVVLGAIIGAAVVFSWSGSVAGGPESSPEHRTAPGRTNAESYRGAWNGTSPRADSSPVTPSLPPPVGPAFSDRPGDVGPTRSGISGIASWYGGSRGFVGTMHAAVPGGRWTGKVWGSARVCRGEVCVLVDLVDYCRCPGGRVIDLSVEAFRVLGDPRLGLLRVVVWKESKV